jgi:outer membrane protein OmpA-like peptidoglycan-associated protein
VKSASAVLALLPATALALYMGLPLTSQSPPPQENSLLLAQLADENSQLSARLEDAHEELLALGDKNAVLSMEYHWLEQEKSGLQLASTSREVPAGLACCADTKLVLHFRSDSAAIEKHYRVDLAAFVDTALAIPGAVVELTGHTDKRGNADTNLQLSRARLAAVEHRLRELGLQNMLVETTALGARHAKGDVDSAEDAFFDRRVEVRIRTVGRQLLSSKD